MAKHDYSAVSVLIFDPDLSSRNATKFALTGVGVRRIEEHISQRGLTQIIDEHDFDLIMLDCSTAGRRIFKLVEDIRNGKVGKNPFVAIVLTVWHPTETLVVEALQSGIDDLVMKPVSANVVVARIDMLVSRRKPFVFEESYIGPLRKTVPEQVDARAPVPVPNTLRAKATKEPTEKITQQLIDQIISFQRCKRLQAQLETSIDSLKRYFDQPERGEFPLGLTATLPKLADEFQEEAHLGAFLHIVELSKALRMIGKTLHNSGVRASRKEIDLLEQMGDAFRVGLMDRRSAVDAASAIAEAITKSRRARR